MFNRTVNICLNKLFIHPIIFFISTEGKARQQQQPQRESSINNNAIVPIDSFVNREIAGGDGGIGDEELVIPSTEVTAQKGGTATLPCKFTEPGAGIVSISHLNH